MKYRCRFEFENLMYSIIVDDMTKVYSGFFVDDKLGFTDNSDKRCYWIPPWKITHIDLRQETF
jgi:hypothetical protein